MTDKLQKDVLDADRAKRLLGDPALVKAFAAIEEAYIEAWRATKAMDTDARERLWQALQIVGIVQSNLQSVVSSGTLAKAEIEQIERLGDRKKLFGVI